MQFPTANAINTYSTEINNYRNLLPDDVYSLIYFFDEILVHLILYTGIFGLIGLLTIENTIKETKYLAMAVLGLLFGLGLSVTIIESSQVIIVIPAFIWIGFSIIWKQKKMGFPTRPIFGND